MPQTRSASFILAVTLASFGLPGCSFSYSASTGSKAPSSSEGRTPKTGRSPGRSPGKAPAATPDMDKGKSPTPAPAPADDTPSSNETPNTDADGGAAAGSNRPAAPSDTGSTVSTAKSGDAGNPSNSTFGAKKAAAKPKGVGNTKTAGTANTDQPIKEKGLRAR